MRDRDEVVAEVYVDPGASLANERTMLAWVRTSLALIAGGLAATELLPASSFAGSGRLVGLPLVAAGGVIAVMSHVEWRRREAAIRALEPLPPSWLPRALSLVVALAACVAIVASLLSAMSS